MVDAKKVLAYVSILTLMMVLCAGLVVKANYTPMVTILPDKNLEKGETVTVKGTNFPINTTVRIDLLLPDSTPADGIAYATVDDNGTFLASFICPDKNGDGYVKITDGTIMLSVLVTFKGSYMPNQQIQVSMNPSTILSDESSHITVMASFLENENYVTDILFVNPIGEDSTSYYVLHKGKLELDFLFKLVGYYWMNISIENTPYYYAQYIDVRQNPNDDDDGGGNTNFNVTFEVTSTGNEFDVMLWKEGSGYISGGNVTVKSPDGKTKSVPIVDSVAVVTATSMGTYTIKYISNGKQFSTTFSYHVTITFTSSNFDSEGKTDLRLLVDGNAPTGTIDVNVTGAVDTVISLDNGETTYTATVVGDYTFQVSYMGLSKSVRETYDDTYSISTLDTQIIGDTIYVTGMVLGDKTQSAGESKQVQISVPTQDSYKTIVTTEVDGSFEAYVNIVNKGGIPSGMDVQVKANIYQSFGSSASIKTATVHVGHDIFGEFGVWFFLIGLGIFALLWYTGCLYKWSKQKWFAPPKKILAGGRSKSSSGDDTGW